MLKETKKIIQLYEQRGFQVMDIHADNEFECIRDDIRPVNMDTVPVDEHVGEIERSIRTTKERTRCTIHGLPYQRYTKAMIIDLVNTCTRSLNQIPAQDGISDRISPLTLVTGKGNIDYNKLKLAFGSYVQVLEDNTITNTTAPRSIGAIALSISANENGYYRFMNLNTGKVLARRKFQELPITAEVIRQVEALALAEGQPKIKNGCPIFGWNPEDDIGFVDDDDEDDDDSDYEDEGQPDDDDHDINPDDFDNISTHDEIDHDVVEPGTNDDDPTNDDRDTETSIQGEDNESVVSSDESNTEEEPDEAQRSVHDDAEEIVPETVTDENNEEDTEDEPDDAQRSARAPHRHNLRGNRRDYSHRLDHAMDEPASKKSYDGR
jgi:hypothetical protein